MKEQKEKITKLLKRVEDIREKQAKEARFEFKETIHMIKELGHKDEQEKKRIADIQSQ